MIVLLLFASSICFVDWVIFQIAGISFQQFRELMDGYFDFLHVMGILKRKKVGFT